MAPAHDALTSPCLTGPITQYSWVEGIVLMTIFAMLFLETMAARSARSAVFEHHHGHKDKVEADPEKNGT
jgi:zinc transporter 1/2/3